MSEAPAMPPAKQPTTMPERLEKVRDEVKMLERALAGYTTLTTILGQLDGSIPNTKRAKGPPVLSYRATADGVSAVEVVADLSKLQPQFLPHVLSPMANIHAMEMYEALQGLVSHSSAMLAEVTAALGLDNAQEAVPEQPATPPATPPVATNGPESPTQPHDEDDEERVPEVEEEGPGAAAVPPVT